MEKLTKLIQAQFDKMCETGMLFKSSITGQQVWDAYLNGFGDDPLFRDPNSSIHNCNTCKNFIRRYGNIVAIDDNYNIMTMFDIVDQMNQDVFKEYSNSMNDMHQLLVNAPVSNVFVETFDMLKSLPYEACKKTNQVFRLGINKNHKRYTKEEAEKFGVVVPGEIRTFHHFHLDIPREFIDFSGKSTESVQTDFRSAKDVFKRTLNELPVDTLELVRDLINQGSLLNGDTYLPKVMKVLEDVKKFKSLILSDNQEDNYAWVHSYQNPFAKFKNELIGVFCTELAEGMELNKACINWNKRVDPVNYMKAKSPITETQKKRAQEFVEENGYLESFDRRFARLGDIDVNEIIHKNVKNDTVKAASIFDKISTKSTSRHKRNEFKGIEEVHIDKFMKDILPTCTSVEVYLENRHQGNLVTLTTSKDPFCKQMFKWDNPYSWTYSGNLAGKSMIKQAVKLAGGNIEGVLNFRLAWNDNSQNDRSDLDAWATEPNNTSIGYSSSYRKDRGDNRTSMSGQLDVDNTDPNGKIAVENITWTDSSKMKDGQYKLWVNQFSARNSQGFKAEIEFNGEIHSYSYDKPVVGNIVVAIVTLKNGEFTIEHKLPSSSTSKTLYGLDTQQFHKVNLVCLSPNYWGENNVGHKHFFFMLDKCKADKALRSFHNENLNSELRDHRKVLDILANVNMLEPTTDKELSGVGFNSTVRDEVILRLKGNFKRTIKVKF